MKTVGKHLSGYPKLAEELQKAIPNSSGGTHTTYKLEGTKNQADASSSSLTVKADYEVFHR